MRLNLHSIVRGAIQTVNPDTPGTVYVSTGSVTLRGIKTPTFAVLPATRLQAQAATHEQLYHLNGLAYTGGMSTIYAYGNFSAITRPNGQGGDLVNLGTLEAPQWWAIQHVLEWWPGWCCVAVTRQLNAATVDALVAALKNGAVPVAGAP